eukprot:CAMPEP_0204575824 /NCGR_PEP_ID=MMETSP0661-20131031/41421_1 /ASSEMBLY_ACC=CAM_ASM_000606 /TAXON_ID=109239 /ORGANISM="Alexandrium margalefi, Strain AMGDE01CS-322" /LENGTH=181 /DNA_ID=CAMNT_0051584503 /DNA_START=57 /DNA_END=602 /DNA_ORIENTATION=+
MTGAVAMLQVGGGEALRVEGGKVSQDRAEGILRLLKVSGLEPSPFSLDEADASMVALDSSGEVVGFVQGFMRGDTVCLCQVCVHPSLRRCGLATRMLEALASGRHAKTVEASVMPNNMELRDTIRLFASAHRCPCTLTGKWQLEERFPTSRKALTQFLYRVGPLAYKDHLDSATTAALSRL